MLFLEDIKQTLLLAVTEVRSILGGEGDSSIGVCKRLAKELDGALGSASDSFGILCPNQIACDGSCVASSQGVWTACKDVLLAAIQSVL